MNADVWGLVLTAAIGHALWNFAARKAAGDAAIIWLSVVVGVLVAIPFCAYTWWQSAPPPLPLSWSGGLCLVATGIIHGLYFALLAEAYEHGEISLVYPVARGSGVGLTALAAWLALGEDISLLGASGIALVLAGIFCLGASAFKHQTHGLQLALGVGLTIVCYSLVDKIGVGYVQPLYYITGMWLIGSLVRAPWVVRRYGAGLLTIARVHWPVITLIGVASLGTYLLILYAYTQGPVGYIVAVRESSVVIGALLGWIFLKERLTLLKVTGLLAIVGGLVLIKAS